MAPAPADLPRVRPTTASAPADARGYVLLVDDLVANRELLRNLLESQGHEVVEAADGAEALAAVARRLPEVILLDVQMPGIDGYEVCRRLKADPETAPIPVLFVTALHDRDQRLLGIRAGANDFITKPIDGADLMLRVRNALRVRRLYLEVQSRHRELLALEELRDTLVHMVVHDLRSPLTALYGNIQLIEHEVSSGQPVSAEGVVDALRMTRRLMDMVSDMLDVSRLEAREMPLKQESVILGSLIAESVRGMTSGEARVVYDLPPAPVMARCDPDLIGRVITNLLDNAIKFTPADAPVHIALAPGADHVRVSVRDAGPGIPRDAQSVIFEKFGQVGGVRQARRSSGLGLAFCKLAVEAHGGVIGVTSEPGVGSTFWFTLPAD